MAQSQPISIILPVLNEAENLPAALASVSFADEVIIVDSGSTDSTRAIASQFGARIVDFSYDGSEKKKTWTLRSVIPRNEWVFFLDADERISDPLRAEITAAIRESHLNGYFVDREFYFLGRRMRSFQPNWNMRLFRFSCARVEDFGLGNLPDTGDNEIHEHFLVDGPTGFLKAELTHDDYRGISDWVSRHNRYATWEAHLYQHLSSQAVGTSFWGLLRLSPPERKRALRRIWVRVPLRPPIRFVVWYVLRGGMRDGRAGLTFCLLMAYYELLIGIKLSELNEQKNQMVNSTDPS